MKTVLIGATDLTLAVAEVLASTPEVDLVGCVGAGHRIEISYAPEGRPNLRHGDLESWSAQHEVPFHRFTGNPDLRPVVEEWSADLAVVAGWFHLVPRSVRDAFRLGVVGLHASLLPAFRGGAPLNWAILSGAEQTGISLFVLADGVDEGPLYGQTAIPIGPRTNVGDLVRETTAAGLELIRTCLPALARGELEPFDQVGEPSYSLHREPEDGRIDWGRSAVDIDRLVRSVTRPYPGAIATLDGEELLIWDTEPLVDVPKVWSEPGGIARLPGQDDPLVITGDGALAIRAATRRDGTDCLPLLRSSAYRRFS